MCGGVSGGPFPDTPLRCKVRRAAQQRRQAQLEEKCVEVGRGAGLRQLKQIMSRLVKSDAAMRVEVWRSGKEDEKREREMENSKAARSMEMVELEATCDASMKGVGLGQVKQILGRLMKESQVMRVEAWRSGMKDEKRAIEMIRLKAELGLRAVMRDNDVRGAALLQLMQMLARLTKDELAMRLGLWRSGMEDEKRAIEMIRLKAELGLRAVMRDNDVRGAALLQLMQMLARLTKDELAMRLGLWRSGMEDEKRAIEMIRLKAELGLKAVTKVWARVRV